MAQERSLLGIFAHLDDLLAALRVIADNNLEVHTVYSPVPRHEIQEALALKPSRVRFFTLTGGILGISIGVGLTIYTSLQWNFIVAGKPVIPLVPAVIVGFEFCILISVLFNLLGLLVNSRLPRFRLPDHYDARFTEDRFGLLLTCTEAEHEKARNLLREAGAEEIHEVEG